MNTGQWIIVGCLVPVFVAMVGGIVELRKTRVTASGVAHEVRPNTGGSMRDAVDRAEAAVKSMGNKLDQLHNLVHEVDKRVAVVEARTGYMVPIQRESHHVE